MTTVKLKERIKALVGKGQDDRVLRQVHDLLGREATQFSDPQASYATASPSPALLEKLKRSIDGEQDERILRAIEVLLDDSEAGWEARCLMGQAIQSDADIANGRTLTLDEAKRELQRHAEVRRARNAGKQ